MSFLKTSILAVASLLLAAVAYIFYTKQRYESLKRQHGCSDPPRYKHKDPVFGLDLFMKTGKEYEENRYLPELDKMFEQNGITFETLNMGSRSIFTIDTDNLRSIFIDNATQWGIEPIRLSPMEPFCGRGFLTADGDIWRHSRRLFSPSFEKKAIADFSALEDFTKRMLDILPAKGKTVDMQPLLSDLFIDATTLFLFGESFSDMSGSFTAADVSKAFDQAMFGSGMRIALGPLGFLGKTKKWLNACKQAQSFAQLYVDRAVEMKDQSTNEKARSKKSTVLLQSLASQSQDKDYLRNNILQAFFVSQGTTANCVSNVLFLVSRLPGCWEQLRKEVMAAVTSDSKPTYEQLHQLVYLQKVINEALRLLPVLPQNNRTSLADVTLPKGGGKHGDQPIFVEKGTMVCVSYYTLHRRKELWGPDAEVFNPDRWDKMTVKDAGLSYLPFGAGPRQCIGKDKALTEAAYVMVRLLQNFEHIEPRDDKPWQGQVQLSAQNLHGCKVAFS